MTEPARRSRNCGGDRAEDVNENGICDTEETVVQIQKTLTTIQTLL